MNSTSYKIFRIEIKFSAYYLRFSFLCIPLLLMTFSRIWGNRLIQVLFALFAVGVCTLAILFITSLNRMGALKSKHLDRRVSGTYFSNWSVYEPNHYPLDLPAASLTHIFYAFMKINSENGEVSLSDTWADEEKPMPDGEKGALNLLKQLKKREPHLKSVMSIGGWGTEDQFRRVLESPNNTKRFVDSAIDLASKYGFDGIDVDWEYPQNAAEGLQLQHLLQVLRKGLGENKILSVAVTGLPHIIDYYQIQEMNDVLDFWNLMCYDFSGSGWSSTTGEQSNLYKSTVHNLSGEAIVNSFIERGADALKIVLGMPLYARSFYKPSGDIVGATFAKSSPYPSDTVDFLKIPLSDEKFDAGCVSASVFDTSKMLWLSFDNVASAIHKAKFVEEKGLRGGFWWDLKGDRPGDESLIVAFALNLQ